MDVLLWLVRHVEFLLFWIFFIIITISCFNCFELCKNFIILWCTLGCREEIRSALKVKQIVCSGNSRQAMSYHHYCETKTCLRNRVYRSLYFKFTSWIETRCCFIENQNCWILNKCTSNSNTLFLPSCNTCGANTSVNTALQVKNKTSLCFSQCITTLFFCCVSIPIE